MANDEYCMSTVTYQPLTLTFIYSTVSTYIDLGYSRSRALCESKMRGGLLAKSTPDQQEFQHATLPGSLWGS